MSVMEVATNVEKNDLSRQRGLCIFYVFFSAMSAVMSRVNHQKKKILFKQHYNITAISINSIYTITENVNNRLSKFSYKSLRNQLFVKY